MDIPKPRYRENPIAVSIMVALCVVIMFLMPDAFSESFVYGLGFFGIFVGGIFYSLFPRGCNPCTLFFGVGLGLQSWHFYFQDGSGVMGLVMLFLAVSEFLLYLVPCKSDEYAFSPMVIEQLKEDFGLNQK